MSFKTIALTTNGQSIFNVDMGTIVYLFVTKFNHKILAWILDIQDVDENVLIAGLLLRPDADILIPYPQLKKDIGSLVIVEKQDNDYQDSDKLGTDVLLLWYPPGETVVLPV